MSQDALSTSSWELLAGDGGPRRPSLADLGGAELEDDDPAPDPTEPNANALNQMALQCAAFARVVPAAVLTITIPAATPILSSFSAASSTVVSGTFTITDNGTGDTSITWPASSSPPTLPPPVANPVATCNDTSARMITAEAITNGVRVRTWDHTAAAVDAGFTVIVF